MWRRSDVFRIVVLRFHVVRGVVGLDFAMGFSRGRPHELAVALLRLAQDIGSRGGGLL